MRTLSLNRTVKFNRICILVSVMVFTLTLTGCASSHSKSNKNTDVKESKRTEKVSNSTVENKSNFTVDDLKQHPKMSATAITLYGDTHIQKNQKGKLSSKDETNFEKGFNLAVESVNSTTAKYYTNSDKLSKFSYYILLGSNHDQVTYYDTQDKALLKVSLADVIRYLNKTLTSAEMTSVADSIEISTKESVNKAKNGSDTSSSSETQTWSGKTAADFLEKVDSSSPEGASIVGEKYVIFGTEAIKGSDPDIDTFIEPDRGAVVPANDWFISGDNRSGAGARSGVVLTQNADDTVTMIMCNGFDLNPYLKATVRESDYKVLSQEDLGIQGSLTDYFGGKSSDDALNYPIGQEGDSSDDNQSSSDDQDDDSSDDNQSSSDDNTDDSSSDDFDQQQNNQNQANSNSDSDDADN